jgi:hypothetical protein
MGAVGGGGSTSPLPPHTSQRRWPTPSHFLQFPIVIPAIIRFPVPLQARQALVLWPWHLGHKTLSGIICFLRYLLMKIWDEAALGRWGKGLTSPRPPRSQSGPLKREEGTPYSGTVLCSANAALRWIKFLSENDQARCFHLERAALRAMAVRFFAERDLARARPPFWPPFRPRATAAGSFSVGSIASCAMRDAISTTRLMSQAGLRGRLDDID